MGREASVAYFTSETEECACSLFAEEGDHCCDNTQELIKLEDSQKTLAAFELHFPTLALLGALYADDQAPDLESSRLSRALSADEQPPPKILYQLHCSFVFYDIKSVA